MYQQLHKSHWGKVYRMQVFRENSGKFGQNIPCTPKKLLAPTSMEYIALPQCLTFKNPFALAK